MRQRGYGFGGAHRPTARERTQVRGSDEWEEPDWKPQARTKGGAAQHLPTIAGQAAGVGSGWTTTGRGRPTALLTHAERRVVYPDRVSPRPIQETRTWPR